MEINKKLLIISASFLITLSLSGCSRASLAQLSNTGEDGIITCYSGGKVIYQGESTGKVQNEDKSDGYYFEEKGTDDMIETNSQCIIRYKSRFDPVNNSV